LFKPDCYGDGVDGEYESVWIEILESVSPNADTYKGDGGENPRWVTGTIVYQYGWFL